MRLASAVAVKLNKNSVHFLNISCGYDKLHGINL